MRKLWLGILATLLVVVFVAPSFAWEFSMTGEFDWRHNYLSRMGEKDIFGNASIQDAGFLPVPGAATAYIGFAGPNIYGRGIGAVTPSWSSGTAGVAITRGGFSRWGDAAWIADQKLTFVPNIHVNKAIRIFGTYTVGGFRNKFDQSGTAGGAGVGVPPFERYHQLGESASAYNTAAIGSWEMVRFNAQLPWGTLALGLRDFSFGNGIMYANNTATSSTLLVVPYGPFRLLGVAMLGESTLASQGWNTTPDIDQKLNWRFGAGFTYDNGPLSFGFLVLPQFIHNIRAGTASSSDISDRPWDLFLKYNNGRFFANLEYYFRNVDRTNNYSPAVTGTAIVAGIDGPRFAENNKWMAEIGALVGPAKISVAAFYDSGQVLPGVDVNVAGNTFNATKQYTISNMNYQVLQPYSFLMFPTYAGGNNRFNAGDGTGEMGDAFALAARADYAAAANLNLWGSYMHARRAEKHGYYAGSFWPSANAGTAQFLIGSSYPTAAGATTATVNGSNSPVQAANFKGQYGGTDPFVADDFIGWEAQAGVDWKLLENFTAKFAYSYWQLGPWFDQAYQAYTFGSGTTLSGGGILIGRDPIQSFRGSLTIDF
jgi:hypothetical protein